MPSTAATINKALNLYAHHIEDVGVEIALPGKAKNGWKKYCKLFCDNVIFWALVDTGGDVEKQRKNSISAILEALEEQDVNQSMVKIVQQGMMESAEVMSSLGSCMESLVISTINEKLHKRLQKACKTGLSQLEVKFYGGDLYDHAYYENYLEQVKEIIQECPTCEVPFTEYWKYMASKITSMVAVFASGADTSAFAYCHWRNSITAKKYGTMHEKVGHDEALKLLANYSFNN
ncbi:MAG: hypothetical protein BYD32DRAFT_434555 [Podila humilis]|nr:MAG: hypothetical protein BYD32DRAFT_434555 [Podila humilis]